MLIKQVTRKAGCASLSRPMPKKWFNSETRSLLAASNLTISDAGTPMLRTGVTQCWGVYLEPMANWGTLDVTANMVGYRRSFYSSNMGANIGLRWRLLPIMLFLLTAHRPPFSYNCS